MESFADIQHQAIAGIRAVGDQAMQRYESLVDESPSRAAAYLRQGIAAAKHLARLAQFDPELWAVALVLLERVFAAAHQAEARLFAEGKSGAAYLNIILAAAAARAQIAAKAAETSPEAAKEAIEPTAHAPSARQHAATAAAQPEPEPMANVPVIEIAPIPARAALVQPRRQQSAPRLPPKRKRHR